MRQKCDLLTSFMKNAPTQPKKNSHKLRKNHRQSVFVGRGTKLTMGVISFTTRLVAVLVVCELATAFMSPRHTPGSRLQESVSSFDSNHPAAHAATATATTTVRGSANTDEAEVSSQEEGLVAVTPLPEMDPDVAAKFKVVTCMSKACSEKRTVLMQDQLSTFSAFWARSQDRAPSVQVEESPCLGSCKQAPCVGIVHEDYEGSVALEGMSEPEFNSKVFQRVVTEADADRVWSCIENAIVAMAEEEDEDESDE